MGCSYSGKHRRLQKQYGGFGFFEVGRKGIWFLTGGLRRIDRLQKIDDLHILSRRCKRESNIFLSFLKCDFVSIF
jgi:hypothetical protein